MAAEKLLEGFSALVRKDRANTSQMLAHIAEIDRRKLWAKHAYPSMFAFCVERFHMSEAIAAKRIRAGRAATRFPQIFTMIEEGELHLSGVHQLARHLTDENHGEVLENAKHKTMRQIEALIAEIAPEPDVPSRIVRARRVTPLSPQRYSLQVTLSQQTRDKLTELEDLLSHQIPDGDPGKIIDKALDALLEKARKRRGALATRPRKKPAATRTKTRAIPAQVKRAVFRRDGGQCALIDEQGKRCSSRRRIEFHHKQAFALDGTNDVDNVALRCRAHNQYEADLVYGGPFMETCRRRKPKRRPGSLR